MEHYIRVRVLDKEHPQKEVGELRLLTTTFLKDIFRVDGFTILISEEGIVEVECMISALQSHSLEEMYLKKFNAWSQEHNVQIIVDNITRICVGINNPQ